MSEVTSYATVAEYSSLYLFLWGSEIAGVKLLVVRSHPYTIVSFVSFRSPYFFYVLAVGVEVVYFHLITLRHTPQSVGLLWTKDRPVAETSTWQPTNTVQDKNIHDTSRIRTQIPASARPQTHALDRAATGIGQQPHARKWIQEISCGVIQVLITGKIRNFKPNLPLCDLNVWVCRQPACSWLQQSHSFQDPRHWSCK
jgi:hypothetical protein